MNQKHPIPLSGKLKLTIFYVMLLVTGLIIGLRLATGDLALSLFFGFIALTILLVFEYISNRLKKCLENNYSAF